MGSWAHLPEMDPAAAVSGLGRCDDRSFFLCVMGFSHGTCSRLNRVPGGACSPLPGTWDCIPSHGRKVLASGIT